MTIESYVPQERDHPDHGEYQNNSRTHSVSPSCTSLLALDSNKDYWRREGRSVPFPWGVGDLVVILSLPCHGAYL